MNYYPVSEAPFLNVQSELPLMPLYSISLYFMAGHQREEMNTSHSAGRTLRKFVLDSSGIELMFFPSFAVFWI